MYSEDSEMSSGLTTLQRDCTATLIPYGTPVVVNKGEQVRITQALGGSYTVLIHGNLVRIEGKDADALGKEPPVADEPEKGEESQGPVDEEAVWNAMRNCYDPEIPVNIVDLGLIYSCKFFPEKKGGTRVEVKMTLTTPGCGMGGQIAEEVKSRILGVPGVSDVEVDLIWDPPWSREMMSDAAKLQLGMM